MILSFDEALKRTKSLKPHFENGRKGKAFYSDINFDLLGEIAKIITHKGLSEIYDQFIIEPLELEHTFLCKETSTFAPIYLNEKTFKSAINYGNSWSIRRYYFNSSRYDEIFKGILYGRAIQ